MSLRVFKTYEKRYKVFRSKKSSQKTLLIPKFVTDWLISNWTSYRTIQGVIVLVISNRPRASRSSDFEITPWIVLHSVQLLILILRQENPSCGIYDPWLALVVLSQYWDFPRKFHFYPNFFSFNTQWEIWNFSCDMNVTSVSLNNVLVSLFTVSSQSWK